jgi:hypothetical protein
MRVPVWDREQVSPAATPEVYKRPPGSTGNELVARGLNQVGDAINSIAEDAYKKAVVADTTKGKADLEAAVTQLYYHEVDGAFHKYGEDGIVSADKAFTELQKVRSNIRESLKTETAKKLFDLDSQKLLESYNRKGQVHQAKQRQVVAAARIDALQKNVLNALPFVYDDPEERERLINSANDAIRHLAPSKEAAKTAIFEFQKEAHKAVLKGFLANEREDEAQAYFNKHEKAFGADADKVREVLEVAGVHRKADNFSTLAIKNAKNKDTGWVDPGLARALVEDLDVSQKVKDETWRRLEVKIRKAEHEKNHAIGSVYVRIAGAYESKQKWAAEDEQWLKKHDPDGWHKLRMRMRADTEYWRRLKEGRVGETPQQMLAYDKLRADMIKYSREYAEMPVEELYQRHWTELSPGGFEQARKDFIAHKQRMTNPNVNLPEVSKLIEMEIGLRSLDDSTHGGDADLFRSYISGALGERLTKDQTKLTRKELRDLFNDAQMEVLIQSSSPGWAERMFEDSIPLRPHEIPMYLLLRALTPGQREIRGPKFRGGYVPGEEALEAEGLRPLPGQKSMAERILELNRQGKSREEIQQIISSEPWW